MGSHVDTVLNCFEEIAHSFRCCPALTVRHLPPIISRKKSFVPNPSQFQIFQFQSDDNYPETSRVPHVSRHAAHKSHATCMVLSVNMLGRPWKHPLCCKMLQGDAQHLQMRVTVPTRLYQIDYRISSVIRAWTWRSLSRVYLSMSKPASWEEHVITITMADKTIVPNDKIIKWKYKYVDPCNTRQRICERRQ